MLRGLCGGFFEQSDSPLSKFFGGCGEAGVKRNEGYPYVEKGKPSFVV